MLNTESVMALELPDKSATNARKPRTSCDDSSKAKAAQRCQMLQSSAETCPYGISKLLDILKASAVWAPARLLRFVSCMPGMQHLQIS